MILEINELLTFGEPRVFDTYDASYAPALSDAPKRITLLISPSSENSHSFYDAEAGYYKSYDAYDESLRVEMDLEEYLAADVSSNEALDALREKVPISMSLVFRGKDKETYVPVNCELTFEERYELIHLGDCFYKEELRKERVAAEEDKAFLDIFRDPSDLYFESLDLDDSEVRQNIFGDSNRGL